MSDHRIVGHEEWTQARKHLLAKEKEFNKLRDELSAARRALPWERVAKDYVFEGPGGRESFGQLFDGRHQLIVYHFMFGPDWEAPCKSCSFWADNFERAIRHLNARDVTMVAVSRAPVERIEGLKKRLGWTFKWVSSAGSDFNRDYHVSFSPDELAQGEIEYNYRSLKSTMEERPGISVFYRDEGGAVFHTYSAYARGLDMLNGTYQLLDIVPKGRDEAGLPWPMAWVRLRDEYDGAIKS